mgnify:CR=1 FL=1
MSKRPATDRPHTSRWRKHHKIAFAKEALATGASKVVRKETAGAAERFLMACGWCEDLCNVTKMEGNHKIPFAIQPDPNRRPNQLLCRDCHWLKTQCEYNWTRGKANGPRQPKVSPRNMKHRLFELQNLNLPEANLRAYIGMGPGLSIPELIELGNWRPVAASRQNKKVYAEQSKLANLVASRRNLANGLVHPVQQPQLLPILSSPGHNSTWNDLLFGPARRLQRVEIVDFDGTPTPAPRKGTRFYSKYSDPRARSSTWWQVAPAKYMLENQTGPLGTFRFLASKGDINRVEWAGSLPSTRVHVYYTPRG